MKKRVTRAAVVLLLAFSGVLAVGASATANPALTEVPGLVETLTANPGSVQTGKNTVLFQPGVMAVLPMDGVAGSRAVGQCPRGWLCAWPDIDFGGPMMAIQEGQEIDYRLWWYSGNAIIYVPSGYPVDGWNRFSYNITSVYNNTYNVKWGRFVNSLIAPYNAHIGAPAAYVGAFHNDMFTHGYAY